MASPKEQRISAHKRSTPHQMPIRHRSKAMLSVSASQIRAPSSRVASPRHCHAASRPSHFSTPMTVDPWHGNGSGDVSYSESENPNACGEALASGNDCASRHCPGATHLDRETNGVFDRIASDFGNVLAMINCDELGGLEAVVGQPMSQPLTKAAVAPESPQRGGKYQAPPLCYATGMVASQVCRSYLAKVDLYANSKLPLDLPPMRLYIPTYPLLSLAARYSASVYQKPQSAEWTHHIDADHRTGRRAMVIKCVPMDSSNTIVFAIRGTAHLMDWAVNLNMAPAAPVGVLDDLKNLCHVGFLSATRKMIAPVAKRLRQLLEENPRRSSYCLLITGHSAGGAVAALLYLHILSVSSQAASKLNLMAGCFRRIHCVTFGTPPIALLPLAKPDRRGLEDSVFLSFINEGDLVARADKAYIKSLVRLFASPPPTPRRPRSGQEEALSGITQLHEARQSAEQTVFRMFRHASSFPRHNNDGNTKTSYVRGHNQAGDASGFLKPTWHVPPATFSNAGRLVVLRSGDVNAPLTSKKTVEEKLNEGVVAHFTTDEQLKTVVWGDPASHAMELYAGRIATLAIGAVTVETCV